MNVKGGIRELGLLGRRLILPGGKIMGARCQTRAVGRFAEGGGPKTRSESCGGGDA